MDEEKFIKDNMKLINCIVLKFTEHKWQIEEYKQQAMLITLKVLRSKSYDPSRSKLTSYLYKSLLQGLSRYKIRQGLIPTPYNYKMHKVKREIPDVNLIEDYNIVENYADKCYINADKKYDTEKFKELFNVLTDTEKEVIELRYFQGYKLREVSEIMNKKICTLRYYTDEAKRKLKRRIEWLRKNEMMV